MSSKSILLAVVIVLLLTTDGMSQQPIRDHDRFSGLSFGELKPVFDNLAAILRDEPEKKIYIFVYGGRRSCVGEVDARINRIRTYFTKKHGIKAERIIISDGGYREEIDMDYFILPPDTELPTAVPTVNASEMEWLKESDPKCKKKRALLSRRRV